MKEQYSLGKIDTVPPLCEFEKKCLLFSLSQRVDLLTRTKKVSFEELATQAKQPLLSEVVVTDKTINPPTFFRRTPTDIIQEIKGILYGHFGICEKLSIINASKSPVKRTKEQFDVISSELTHYAHEQFDRLLSVPTLGNGAKTI